MRRTDPHPPADGTTTAPGHPGTGRPPVEVRTSTRRRKYASGFWQGDRIVVVLPARMPRIEREAMVESLVQRVLRHRPHVTGSDEALATRAAALADRYLDGVRPRSVRWSAQQRRRWGSCTPETRDVRISELLRPAPSWVVDAVLVHELAHLLEHGHGPRFRDLVGRYERSADADAFLAGYALGLDQGADGCRHHPGGAGADPAGRSASDEPAVPGPAAASGAVAGARDPTGDGPLPAGAVTGVAVPLF